MKRAILIVIGLIFGVSTAVCCADLFIGQKRYEFKYEVVKSPKTPTYVVKHKPYRNPLVVGFSINEDSTIEPLDPANKKRMVNPKRPEGPSSIMRHRALALPREVHPGETAPSIPGKRPVSKNVPHEKIVKKKILTVYFERGSSSLGTDIAKTLNTLPIDVSRSEFEVRGYTCPLGSMKINTRLAKERAKVVGDALRSHGGKVINEIGKPMCCYASQTDFTKNRRTEIFLLTKEKGGRGTK